MKEYLTFSVIKKIKIKSTLRFHLKFITINLDQIKAMTAHKSRRFMHWWWDCKVVQSLQKISVSIPKDNRNWFTSTYNYTSLGLISTIHLYIYLFSYAHCCCIHNSQVLEITYMLPKSIMNEESVVPLDNEVLLSH